ncbi:MAG: hypothetical protein KA028_00290 [Candidatus Pacebacteria bacterium]|nr:hypothetical protein [Candidatus Paceibacterota bacterium]MBP9851943.1 hypothetical protein [Candidatus Paceibacterota bacterium]
MNNQETQSKRPIWFKAKTYGYGWYPATWQGWFILAIYLVIVIGSATLLGAFRETVEPTGLTIYIIFDLLLTVALIVICAKFGEKAKWRWGKKDQDIKTKE